MKISLIDEEVLEFKEAKTIREIATSIAPHLGRSLIAGLVNDKYFLSGSTVIQQDCKIQFITTNKDFLEHKISAYTGALIAAWGLKKVYGDKVSIPNEFAYENGKFHIIVELDEFQKEDLGRVREECQKLIDENEKIICSNVDYKTLPNFQKFIDYYTSTYDDYLSDLLRENYIKISVWEMGGSKFLPAFAFYEELGKIKHFAIKKMVESEERKPGTDGRKVWNLFGFAAANESFADEYKHHHNHDGHDE